VHRGQSGNIESHYAGIATSASLMANGGTVDDGMRQLKGSDFLRARRRPPIVDESLARVFF
jgi:hypothetical protein